MKPVMKITAFLVLLVVVFAACKKKKELEGCTDPSALNYNTLAIVDDGTCTYLDSSVTIWENGELGSWGDVYTGTFINRSCFTGSSIYLLNPDTTFVLADTTFVLADTTYVPADTVITVSPPDTLITPADTLYFPADTLYIAADTTIVGDPHLLVESDTSGRYELILQLLNKRSATDFANGVLIFEAKLLPGCDVTDFGVFIHGNQLNYGGEYCPNFMQSDFVNVLTSALDTTDFHEITIPLTDFANRYMKEVDLMFGIKGSGASPNTQMMIINSVKWKSR